MQISALILASSIVFVSASASAEKLKVVHVADLPVAALRSPEVELAQLATGLSEIINSDDLPTNTEAKLQSGYGEDHFSGEVPQNLPEGWAMTWQTTGFFGTNAIATLRRGRQQVKVNFESKAPETVLYRLAGAPSNQIFEVIDLNARYMAVHGSGDWSYRFVDKWTGAVLGYAVADNPNHRTDLFVDRSGALYIEIVKTRVCEQWSAGYECLKSKDTSARSLAVDRTADGIRKLEFDAITLTAPLSPAQFAKWDSALIERKKAEEAQAKAEADAKLNPPIVLLSILPWNHRKTN